jgi:hypothetical protein
MRGPLSRRVKYVSAEAALHRFERSDQLPRICATHALNAEVASCVADAVFPKLVMPETYQWVPGFTKHGPPESPR